MVFRAPVYPKGDVWPEFRMSLQCAWAKFPCRKSLYLRQRRGQGAHLAFSSVSMLLVGMRRAQLDQVLDSCALHRPA